ncbi:MAG: precorrin-6y C5,15-methyltransferase (decarboxylating) subunit CbiE [Pseudomonadota bacterium]
MTTQTAWLTLVGCLPSGRLAPTAPPDALSASAVFGAPRLLEATGVTPPRARPFGTPLSASVDAIVARAGEPTTVLASGDPLHHGIGATLLRALPTDAIEVHPAPSAFSLAAAALCWPLETVRCASLHNALPGDVRALLSPGQKILLLTRDGAAPAAIAAAITAAGFGDSAVTILGNLGSAAATRHDALARTLTGPAPALNVMAVTCIGPPPLTVDDLTHDGCVTRDEVRALTLAALGTGGHLWDVGAGSGSIAIAHVAHGGTATLFERDGARVAAIFKNLAARHTPARVLEGEAADRLAEAAPPDAIFHGGALASDALFDALWAALLPGGRFVANAVTLPGEAALMARFGAHGGSLTRIALSHAAPVGRLTAMKPAMTVLQWRAEKGA